MNNVVNVKFGEKKDPMEDWPTRRWLPFEKDSDLRINIRMAQVIGLKESVILCDIAWLMEISGVERDGAEWIKLSYRDILEEIGYLWSDTSIKKAIRDLKELGILVVRKYDLSKMDRTNWYCIDHDRLNEVCGCNRKGEKDGEG